MNISDFLPEDLAKMREEAERVIVLTPNGHELGFRSKGMWSLGNCLGTMSITDSGLVYHSMLGSTKVWNKQELQLDRARQIAEIEILQKMLDKLF